MADAAGAGAVRHDVPAEELASYCVHALAAAGNSSTTAMDRLLDIVWTGITSTPSTQTHGVDSAPSETSAEPMNTKSIDTRKFAPGGRAEDGEPTLNDRPAAYPTPSRPPAASSPCCDQRGSPKR